MATLEHVLRTPRIPLLGALACAVGLAITGALAILVPIAHAKDAVSLQAFIALNRPRLTPTIDHVAHLADPAPYALIGISLALVALARGRGRVALAIVALLVVTGLTTETLKQLLATPRFSEWLGDGQIASASWPSGHATASMTLALCGVLAAPARWRPAAAGIGASFAIAVSYAILALGWHFPSDVIGGFLVAAMWTLLAVAALVAVEGPKESRARGPGGEGVVAVTMGAGLAAVVFVVAVARPTQLSTFAHAHTSFFVVSAAIAVLATGLAFAVSESVPAPRAARRRRSQRG
jgi:membrane-associated phospholipid phosphatase